MLILLRVLLVVGCGPLLVPAGLCVCHADITDLAPHEHEADCPPSVQAEPPQPTLSVLAVVDLGPTPEPVVAAPVARCLSVAPPSDRIPSPPLFVSHCALIL